MLNAQRRLPAARFSVALALFLLLPAVAAVAAETGHDFEHRMTVLALEIGIVLFAGYLGARVARRVGIPIILGEVVAGILIGPYLLGSMALPGFPEGLFPLVDNALSISPELYGFAVVASVVLLFLMGLQTDLRLFLRFALAGSVVGLSGAAVSVAAGLSVGALMLGVPLSDPRVLFLGVVAIATSVDITGRILSERRKMASPEGVTILAASVIEDVVGITFLAIILGIDAIQDVSGNIAVWREITAIAGRALAVWLGFSALGILFSRQISRALKSVKNPAQIAVLSLGLAFILAGLFETAGLAMIIGAYVTGLSLANTDIAYVVQEKIETVHQFFDPIFFTVTGMLVNVFVLASGEIALYGLFFGFLAVGSKVVGCGLPSLALGFNGAGATRIALGMVPRGEVALVIASIGLAAGILDDRTFGVALFMTLFTTLVGPPVFNRLLKRTVRTTRKEIVDEATVTTYFEFGSEELTRFLLTDVIGMMREEEFFVNASEGAEHKIYHMRKDGVFIAMSASQTALHFVSRPDHVSLINNLVYEAVVSLQQKVAHIRTIAKPTQLRRAAAADSSSRAAVDWQRYLPIECIHLSMEARTKEEVITELVNSLALADRITDTQEVLDAVLEREKTMSTGMQHGVAIPHGRSDSVVQLSVALGILPKGIDFDSLDGKPTQVVFLEVSPKENPGPHLQVLAGITAIAGNEEARERMLHIRSRRELLEFMSAPVITRRPPTAPPAGRRAPGTDRESSSR
jgi:fructose-specific phosphotransferase system IIA component